MACSSASCAILRDLDPAGLAAAADLDLGLDHAGIADVIGGGDRLLDADGGRPSGTGTPWRANSCLPWYSSRSIGSGTLLPSTGTRPPETAMASCPPHGDSKNVSFVTFDVYGTLIDWETGAYDAFQARGRAGRVHDRARRADPAVPRDPAEDQGRLLRALRGGAEADRGGDRQAAGLAAGAVPRRASCPTRCSAGRRSRRPTRCCRRSPRSTRSG